MDILKPSANIRLNEVTGVVFVAAGLFLLLSLVSYHPGDPSWNTATGLEQAANWTGRFGSTAADLIYSVFGMAAFCLPLLVVAAGIQRLRHRPIGAPVVRVAGSVLLLGGVCALLSLFPAWRPFEGSVPAGGIAGLALAGYLIGNFNVTGAAIISLNVLGHHWTGRAFRVAGEPERLVPELDLFLVLVGGEIIRRVWQRERLAAALLVLACFLPA